MTQGCAIHCQNCSMSELCIPFTLNNNELDELDAIIERKRPIHKGDLLFQSGQPLRSLFAIRSGSIKTYTLTESGEEQITAFHLAGDVVGFDGLHEQSHHSFAQALETAMVCEIPFDMLDTLSATMPALRRQIFRMMSQEIVSDQEMILTLSKKTADQRMATFLSQLSFRFGDRGFSSRQFRLSMTRGDIGNYLGLTVETISRLLSRLQKNRVIEVDGKYVTILDIETLTRIAGVNRNKP
ncbi:electron transport transcriptional regulator EtrA [Ferrimonas gelatinilytica]|uniref:Electron transport transcriptional regulator EtrA n=1 Tax=Ferrimonas gelatinilytica TaxID=1255257 RepID=A0ABP9RW80_9GAMM